MIADFKPKTLIYLVSGEAFLKRLKKIKKKTQFGLGGKCLFRYLLNILLH